VYCCSSQVPCHVAIGLPSINEAGQWLQAVDVLDAPPPCCIDVQVGCSQNLGAGSVGSCSVVLGPQQAVGITTTVTKR
jgi:hypothetical protein